MWIEDNFLEGLFTDIGMEAITTLRPERQNFIRIQKEFQLEERCS